MEFSSENFLKLLHHIKLKTISGEFDIEDQERIWNMLLWDKDDAENKTIVSNLFTGWFVNQILSKN